MLLLSDTSDFFSNVVAGVVTEIIIVVFGFLISHVILAQWVKWRYGGWRVVIKEGEEEILSREISARKAKEILTEPADLSVFLKGVISPYERIRCDLIEEGRKTGLLVEDREGKRFVIDLAKNKDCTEKDNPPDEDDFEDDFMVT